MRNYAETFRCHSGHIMTCKVLTQISRCRKEVFVVPTSNIIISKTRPAPCHVSWRTFIYTLLSFICHMTSIWYDITFRRKSYYLFMADILWQNDITCYVLIERLPKLILFKDNTITPPLLFKIRCLK